MSRAGGRLGKTPNVGRDGASPGAPTAEQTITLPAEPASAALARRFVHDFLSRSPHRDLEDAALLCVSELVANVSVHTESAECMVTVRDAPDALTIEVTDSAQELPAPEAAAPFSEHGRGLQIIAALAREWGVRRDAEHHKSVWLRFCDR